MRVTKEHLVQTFLCSFNQSNSSPSALLFEESFKEHVVPNVLLGWCTKNIDASSCNVGFIFTLENPSKVSSKQLRGGGCRKVQ